MLRNSRNPARRNAFTLIELVLALTLVGIMGFTLYASLHQAFQAVKITDNAIEPPRSAELAMELMSKDFENAITPNIVITNALNLATINETIASSVSSSTSTGSTPGNSSGSTSSGTETGWVLAGEFEGIQNSGGSVMTGGVGVSTSGGGNGEIDDVTFFTTADAPQHIDGNGEIKFVELTIETPAGSNVPCLVRHVTSNLLTELPIQWDDEILCRNVTAFTMQYFDGSNWNPDWDSTQLDNTIPVAVQIAMTIQRPLDNGQMHPITFTRVFVLPCSTAAIDPNVNTGTAGL